MLNIKLNDRNVILNHFHYCIVSFYRSFLLSSCGAMWSGRERWGRAIELAMAADLQSVLHKEIFSLESSKRKNNRFWFSTLDYSFSHKVIKHKKIINLYTAMFLKYNVWKAKAVWEKTSCKRCSLKIDRIILNENSIMCHWICSSIIPKAVMLFVAYLFQLLL